MSDPYNRGLPDPQVTNGRSVKLYDLRSRLTDTTKEEERQELLIQIRELEAISGDGFLPRTHQFWGYNPKTEKKAWNNPVYLAQYLQNSEDYRERFLFNKDSEQWMAYEHPVFRPVTDKGMKRILFHFLQKIASENWNDIVDGEMPLMPGGGYLFSIVERLGELADHRNTLEEWDESETIGKCVGFKNGLLVFPGHPKFEFYYCIDDEAIARGYGFIPDGIQPTDRLTSVLPFNWEEGDTAKAQAFFDWLDFVTFGSKGRQSVMRAYMRACFMGLGAKFQKALLLTGPPNAGKGTFLRIFTYILGGKNVQEMSLERLENGRFDTANIWGKRLVAFPDSEKYRGGMENFKKLTGGDRLDYEVKGRQGKEGFRPIAGVIVMTNFDPPGNGDVALVRRWVTVPFKNAIDDRNADPYLEERLQACAPVKCQLHF